MYTATHQIGAGLISLAILSNSTTTLLNIISKLLWHAMELEHLVIKYYHPIIDEYNNHIVKQKIANLNTHHLSK